MYCNSECGSAAQNIFVYDVAVIQEEIVSVFVQPLLLTLRNATVEESTFGGDLKSFAVNMNAPLSLCQKHTTIQMQSFLYEYCYSDQA